MTKNTGVGRGNNPQSHKNTKRGADHCRWNSQQIISSHGYVKVRVGIGHQLAAIQQAAELLGLAVPLDTAGTACLSLPLCRLSPS